MNQFNHNQLIFAREYRGYTQTELSSKIVGLSQSNLSKFEKGLGTLSSELVEKIVTFLDFPIGFFEKKISNNAENAHYRKRSALTKTEKSHIDYSNKFIGYIVDQMSDSIDFPVFKLKTIDLTEGFTPADAANYIRRNMGLINEPVKEIISLLERAGIIVVEIDIKNDSFDGVSYFTDGGIPLIIINKNMSNDRKRFTVAHELGHLIMHSDISFLISNNRDKEKEAHAFASEFLMPSDHIKKSLYNLRLSELASLKNYWLTSMASIIYKAKELGCIDERKSNFLNIEFSRKGFKKHEPINVYIDTPTLFNSAYRMHIDELNYNDEELAKAFSIPLDVINRFCNPNFEFLRIKQRFN